MQESRIHWGIDEATALKLQRNASRIIEADIAEISGEDELCDDILYVTAVNLWNLLLHVIAVFIIALLMIKLISSLRSLSEGSTIKSSPLPFGTHSV